MNSIHDVEVTTIDGDKKTLSEYAGKTLLIVNVASACGLTPQYEALEALYESKKDEGLEILGFPCNQFGAQEPGTEAEIQEFCSMKFGVKFPLFSKIDVNGDTQHPLYKKLMDAMPERTVVPGADFAGKLRGYGLDVKDDAILWNFEKFLVNGDGEVVGHFSPEMTPEDPVLQSAINRALG